MRPGALFLKFGAMRDELKRQGIGALLRVIAARLSPRNRRDQRRKVADAAAFDAAGYDTGGMMLVDALTLAPGADRDDANAYDATPRYDFEAALASIDIGLGGATFLDLGSGKGRMLLLAAAHPFARIIGVEFAEELQATAHTNLARYSALHGLEPRFELVTGDAGAFDFPDGALVVFLFNPFGPNTLSRVARRLHASWAGDRRPVRIIYVNPQHSTEWTAAGFRQTAVAPDYKFAIYEPV